MSKPINLIAILLICSALLPATGSPSLSASAAPLAAVAPPLGTAKAFAVLGGSTVTSTGTSTLTGDLGVSPGTAVTGFPPGSVTGTIYTGTDAVAVQAQSDVTTAYNNLAGQACNTTYPGTKDLAGLTLVPGVYCAGDFALSETLTLSGGAADIWVFKSASTLITGTDAQVVLSGGGKSCNVWWQVGSSATLGTGTSFAGNILALESITANTNASMFGAALARNGAVTMDTNNISKCFDSNAIALREFETTSAAGSPFELGAVAALMLALGLIVITNRRRAL
jgi:hypothetical protein